MSPSLRLQGVSLSDSGAAVDLTLESRHSFSVFGPMGSGKSQFLRICAGLERPVRGKATKHGQAELAGFEGFGRKDSPLSIAQEASGKNANHAAEALGALGLWDVRKKIISALGSGQLAACQLIRALAGSADHLLIDGHLDLLDPWAYRDTLMILQKRVARGTTLLVATHRPEWAELTDQLVVLQNHRVVFFGKFQDLEGSGKPSELRIESNSREGVRALCAPFEVHVADSNGSTSLRTSQGQALAARMLLEGYGDVQSVVIKRPSPRELLEGLIR